MANKPIKELSIDELSRRIRNLIYDALYPHNGEMAVSPANGYVDEIFDTHVIVSEDGKYYKIPYELTESGISLGEKVEVERAWVPAGKSLWKAQEIDTEKSVVNFGAELKSLGNNRFGGHLVLFSNYKETDLSGEYFDKDTDFDLEFPSRSTSYYNHGLDVKLGRRKIGTADLKLDDAGIWAEIQLQERDEYEKYIIELANAGKLGWSSGTAAHLVEKEPVGKAMYIKRWPLGLDASLTPTPCEPRNTVIPMKSLITVKDEADNPEGDKSSPDKSTKAEPELNNLIQENKTMEQEEIKALVDSAAKDAAATAIEEYKKSLPAIEEAVQITTEERIDKEKPFKSFGEQLQAVAEVTAGVKRGDERLDAIKANGLNEAIPSEGGYLVQTDFSAELLKPIYELGAIASRVDKTGISANSNGMTFNAVDETSRASGSRYGGVLAYWLAEAGTKTATKPKFRNIELKLKKLIGACYATDELLQDAAALQSVISEGFQNEFMFMVEDAFYNGDGVGKPLGVLSSGAFVSVAKESGQAADTIVAENVVKMYSRMAAPHRRNAAWFINQDIEPQLFTMSLSVGTGGVPIYMPANGLAGAPFGTLMGRPVIPVEYAGTVGDQGDIMFADFGAYKAIDKGGVQGASSVHVQFMTDETTFRFVYRVDGQPKWASPVTPFKGSNTVSPFIVLDARA